MTKTPGSRVHHRSPKEAPQLSLISHIVCTTYSSTAMFSKVMLDVAGAVVPMTLRARYPQKRLALGICTRENCSNNPITVNALPKLR